MPNSATVLSNIQELQQASGSTEKVRLLKEYLEDDLFRWVVTMALDPMITYGLKDLDFIEEVDAGKRTLSVDTYEGSSFYRTLRKMAQRELTGNSARISVKGLKYDYDEATGFLLRYILHKDLRAGVGASTVNKARPGTLFEFNVMLAAKLDESKVNWPCIVEPKYDGMRLIAIGDHNGMDFYSRSGKAVDTVPAAVVSDLTFLYTWGLDVWGPKTKMVFDGELMGETFRDTMQQARRKDHEFEAANYYIFDAMPIEVFQKLKAKNKSGPYKDRRNNLSKVYNECAPNLVQTKLPPRYMCRHMDDVVKFYIQFRDRGLEGLIVKNPDGPYHPRRNRDWMKMKGVETVDVPIIDAVEGTGKYEGMLGALIVNVEGVDVNVGTGFHDGERAELWEAHLAGWLSGKIIEVEYHERTPDGSLRHPRFVRFRPDKTKEDGIGC